MILNNWKLPLPLQLFSNQLFHAIERALEQWQSKLT